MVSFVDILRWSAYLFLAIVVLTAILFIFAIFIAIGGSKAPLVEPTILGLALYGGVFLFSILIVMLVIIIILVYIPNILREGEE